MSDEPRNEVQDLANELRGVNHHRITLDLKPSEALTLVAQLQLAARHPNNAGHGKQLAISFIDAIRVWFATHACMAVVDVIRRGDDPAHDVPIDGTTPSVN
jgi:hypothetical protein